MTHVHTSFLVRNQRLLMGAVTLYVGALILFHAALPAMHVWAIAAVFSVLMNGTYVLEALSRRAFVWLEAGVAVVLAGSAVMGVLVSPGFVIFAVLGHGVWDALKHWGAGVPFCSWSVWSCAVIDLAYGGALFAYWLA